MMEEDRICHLFLTLPKSYDSLITALETVTNGKRTLKYVKGKLLDEELKHRKGISCKSVSRCDVVAFVTEKLMFKSEKIGHKRSECGSEVATKSRAGRRKKLL